MNLNKIIGSLIDLIYRPTPSCKEKPLDKTTTISVVIGFLAIAFILWLSHAR